MGWIVFWLACGFVGMLLLKPFDKGGIGFALGALLGPIGVIIAAVMRGNSKLEEERRR